MERSILSWKVVGEVRAATLATSGLAADDVSAFSLPNDSLPRHTFLHRFGQRWSSISSELSRESTCRRIRYRRFSQLGGLWASCMASSEASSMYLTGLPASRFPLGTLRLKENAPELDWCWRPAALLSKSSVMTCPRTAAAEETELLTVLKIPLRRSVAQKAVSAGGKTAKTAG
jgi:hypothetical protein